MALAFGAISGVSTSQTPTSVAVSGSNTIGIVYVVGDSSADNITAVTWDGASMSKIAAVQLASDRWTSAWWVANPTSSSTISFTGGSFWRSYSWYYTGAAQAGQVDSSNTGSSSANAALSIATTVVAENCWLVMAQKDNNGTRTYTASNALSSMRVATDEGGIAIADSNGTVSTGSITGTLTQGAGTDNHAGIAFSIAPYTATANTTNFFNMM